MTPANVPPRNGKSGRARVRELLLFALILIAGFLLRIARLDAKPIWVDEALVWWFARLPLIDSVIKGFTGGPINSNADPLYNVVLHGWLPLAGDSLFSLRFFSVLINLIGVAYLGRVAHRLFGPQAGLCALAIGAVAPMWVFYSQEVRPYAFTPALMLIMVEAVYDIQATENASQFRPWLKLVAGEVLSLYAHGFMLFGVFGIDTLLGLLWLRRLRTPGRWLWLRSWILSQIASLILIAPSIPTYLARRSGFRNPFVPRLTFAEFVNEMWAYFMGIPWEHALDPLPLRLAVALILIFGGIALALGLRRAASRFLADLIWLVVFVMGATLIYAWSDPSVHPRYVLFMTGPILLILAAVLQRSLIGDPVARWIGVGLAASLLVTSASSIDNLYTGRYRGYRHPATRAVTDALKAEFGSQDGIVVINAHDYTLSYYGSGDAPVVFARYDEGIENPADLPGFIQGKRLVGLLRDTNERSDTRRMAAFYLERFGALIRRQTFEGYELSTYQIETGIKPAAVSFQPVDLTWGALALTGESLASGDAVTVALRWQSTPALTHQVRYAAAIRLVDPVTNWEISGADALLLDERGGPTDRWQPGQSTEQVFVLPLQPGTPPLQADLRVTLYDVQTGKAADLLDAAGAPAGQQGALGAVTLGHAPQAWVYEDDRRLWQLKPVNSKSLTGFAADKAVIAPGGKLGLTLGWAIPPEAVKQDRVTIQIAQGNTVIAEDSGPPLQGRSPANAQPGQFWLDRRLLSIRGNAHPGQATLRVIIGSQQVDLQDLEVVGFDRLMERPAIDRPLEAVFGSSVRLLGYHLDAPAPLTAASTVTLTLYWQALADGSPDANYKVFTQMLAADGHLVGQHDGVPLNETRPFSGWLADEYLIDPHPMAFTSLYIGPLKIQIGLYDPVTTQRVLTTDGKDAVVLPEELVVESPH